MIIHILIVLPGDDKQMKAVKFIWTERRKESAGVWEREWREWSPEKLRQIMTLVGKARKTREACVI